MQLVMGNEIGKCVCALREGVRGIRCMAPLILNFYSVGGEQLHAAASLPRERTRYPLRE